LFVWWLCVACAPSLLAQRPIAPKLPERPWANKLFLNDIQANPAQEAPAVVEHDFGTVPYGTLLRKTFTFTNIYDVPLQVIDIRGDDSILKAFPPDKVLGPNEQAEFTVTMNAAAFKGAATKKLLVSVGPKHYSTAELVFKATSREDITLAPGSADFGIVQEGDKSTKAVTIRYTGKEKEWKLAPEVTTKHPWLSVEVIEAARGFLSVDYTIKVNLKDSAPAGAFSETVYLTTNDPTAKLLPVTLHGTILPPVSATPGRVVFDALPTGGSAQSKVLVRTKAACNLTGIGDAKAGISVETFPGQRDMHVVTIKYTAPAMAWAGPLAVKLVSDLPGQPEAVITIEVKAKE
jgi:hypothetical protein